VNLVVFSERLRAPYDEGIKNFAAHLIRALAVDHHVQALTCGGQTDKARGIENIDVNRLFLSPRLRAKIRSFRPQAIVYVPTACATVFSLMRARVLRFYRGHAPTALITLQPRPYSALGRRLVRFLAPDWVLAQSARTVEAMAKIGVRSALIPPAVDTFRFRAAGAGEKVELRNEYGIPSAAKVIAHIGHLKEKRNLSRILDLQAGNGYHVVVAGSTSTQQDADLKDSLRTAGATVIDTYVSQIEHIYHLSDVYLFLVQERTGAIELPLSVLEAMACNLPVICTPFGGLPDAFREGQGLFYWHGQKELRQLVEEALLTPCATRQLVESHTWTAAAASIVRLLQPNGVQA
jgi:glycosyltransferase involved in cell wall biosynthesis